MTTLDAILADDHPLFLEGVKALLNSSGEVRIVGQCRTGREAVQLIATTSPDIAVLDISMPESSGIEVCRQLGLQGCSTRLIVLSGYEDRAYVQEALTAGARAYVLKRSVGDNLMHAIRAVKAGGVYLDPAIASQHVNLAEQKNGGAALTDREREVVRLIALGFTSKEIAHKLSITSKSVETYKSRASEKLGITSRAKLVQYALLQGWMNSPS